MPEERPLPSKLDVARALMLKGSLFIHLDPRVDDVSVPPWLRKQPQLVLQVGLEMALPIPDLVVDEQGVQATLSFSRSPFLCVVPWASVFALVGDDGRGLVWPESMPVEIAAEVDREAQRRWPKAGESEGNVERIVGKAVREVKKPRALREVKRPKALQAVEDEDVLRLPGKGAPGLQLIHGKKAGGRAAARRRRAPHLRVVK